MNRARSDMTVLLAFFLFGALVAFVSFQSGRLYQYVNDIKYPIQYEPQ